MSTAYFPDTMKIQKYNFGTLGDEGYAESVELHRG
jgi:hypothetical protein